MSAMSGERSPIPEESPNYILLEQAKELVQKYAENNPDSVKLIRLGIKDTYIIGGAAKDVMSKENDLDILFVGMPECRGEISNLISFINERADTERYVHAVDINLVDGLPRIRVTDHIREWLSSGQAEEDFEIV
jgi:hypothetical protein